jgi:hypothetical protein
MLNTNVVGHKVDDQLHPLGVQRIGKFFVIVSVPKCESTA